MSVPPDVACDLMISPVPAPISTPPKIHGRNMSCDRFMAPPNSVSGLSPKSHVIAFIERGINSAEKIVFAPNARPNTFIPTSSSGMSSIRPNVPTCTDGNR